MKKVSQSGLLILAASLTPLSAQAFEVAYQPWYAQVDGTVSNQGREVSMRDELGLDHSASHGFAVAEDGWLRLNYTPLDLDGVGTVTSDVNFGGSTYSQDDRLSTDANLTDMGAQIMWRPFSDEKYAMGLAVGGTIKIIDADITVTNLDAPEEGGGLPLLGGGNPSPTERKTVSEVFPMLSLRYRGVLFGDVLIAAEGSYITYDDDEVMELQVGMEVRSDTVGFSLGWHEKRYDIVDPDFGLDARFKGFFGRISFYL